MLYRLTLYLLLSASLFSIVAIHAADLSTPSPISVDAAFGLATRNHLDGKVELQGESRSFSCTDRIWGVFEIENIPVGESEFVSHWYGPSGDTVKSKKIRTRIKTPDKRFYLSSYVQVHSDAILMNFLDPSAGFEKFIGNWKVEILRNGNVIGNGGFRMLC